MPIDEKFVRMQIVGKREEPHNVLFLKSKYFVQLQVIDPRAVKNPIVEREVNLDFYESRDIGDIFRLKLYSVGKGHWCFTRQRAEHEADGIYSHY